MSWLWRSARLGLHRSRTCSSDCPEALAIIGDKPTRDALTEIFGNAGWRLSVVETIASAIALQQKTPVPVIMYDRELKDCDWRDAVTRLSRLASHPCVILLTGSSNQNLWDELVRYGGSEILRVPVDRDALMEAVNSAWFLWRIQQKLRLAAQARA